MASKDFSNKLKELRLKAGYSQKDVYEHFNIPQSTFSSWEVGKSEPSGEMLLKLCSFYKCDMMKEFSSEDNLTYKEWNLIEKYRFIMEHSPDGASVIDAVLNREHVVATKLKEKENRIAELQAAPAAIIELSSHSGARHLAEYFHDASAGAGIFILGNEAAARIAISDSDWDERTDYVIRVNGGSMEPDYMDGDNVMVSQHMELDYGDIGIFVVNGKAYIKEYGETELISRNPDFPNIVIHEADNIVCMGKVLGKLKEEYEIITN